MRYNNQTQIIFSASSNPGNMGTFIYNELFKQVNFNAIYLTRKMTNAKELADSLKALNIYGCSVSMPLKKEIVPFIDELDKSALDCGNLNTIINLNGRLIGHNTDLDGIVYAIKKSAKDFNNFIVYGTGAVARTAIIALKNNFSGDIFLTGRNNLKVTELIGETGVKLAHEKISGSTLLINATPIGDSPDETLIKYLKISSACFDFKVQKELTQILKLAKEDKKEIITGLDMYVGQFQKQYFYYTNQHIQIDKIEKLLELA